MAMGQRPDAMKEEKMAAKKREIAAKAKAKAEKASSVQYCTVEGWRREGEAGLRHGAVAMAYLRDHCR